MTFQTIVTPYGASALDVLRDVVRDLKATDLMAPVTLLMPNNLAGIVARRHLARGLTDPGNGVAGISLATLPRLAERLGAPRLEPRKPATTPLVSAAWRAALDHGSSIFDPVKDHPATIRALVNAHRELRDLTPAALERVSSASALTHNLVTLHRRVTASLADDWYDQTDLLDAAVARLSSDAADDDLGRVVLYLPQQLSLAEARFAAALADRTEVAVIAGMTGVVRADRVVAESLARMGLTLDGEPDRARTAHRVLHASDSDDEVRCVVRDVVASLKSTPAHRVAVLYGSAHPYARLLHEHLTAAGIAFNGAGTRPVVERAIGRGFLDVLRLAEADVPRAAFFTAVSEAPTRTFDGSRVPTSRWERLSRSAAVVHGDDWADRLSSHSRSIEAELAAAKAGDDPFQSRIDALQRDLDSADGLRRFATTLRDRLRHGATLTTWPDLSRWAVTLFEELYGDAPALAQLPTEEQYAATTVESVLRSLADLEAFEPAASLQGMVEVLTLELEAALPRVGRFGEGVLVAPMSAAIGLDVDVLYVVGLAEDSYPGRLGEDALLLERVRELSQGELASYRDRLDAKHRHLLAAFDAAPQVVASFPRGDLRRSTQRLPSRWLLYTLRDLSGNHDLAATEWESARSEHIRGSPSYALSLTRQPLPATEQEWRTQAASANRLPADETVDRGLELIHNRASDAFTRFDGNLTGSAGLPDFADGHRRVSPTALEHYATCPHAYFVERLLGIDQLEQPEEIVRISALDIGNLMHETMRAFITEFASSLPDYGQPWSPLQRTRLREIAVQKAIEFEERGATGHQALWRTERDRILADLDFMLDDDDRHRSERDAQVLASELTFGKDGAEPVAVRVDGGTVLMRGSADKVDRTRDGTLIVIDLKTGSQRTFKPIDSDPIVAGTKLQLPVYAQAARQLLGGKRAEAAYWFVRRDRGWIEVALTAELEATFAAAVGTLVRSIAMGLFPPKAPEVPDFSWVQCDYCNPDGLGHSEVRARWDRKRRDPALHDLVRLVEPSALTHEPTDTTRREA